MKSPRNQRAFRLKLERHAPAAGRPQRRKFCPHRFDDSILNCRFEFQNQFFAELQLEFCEQGYMESGEV
jgi:hypothetical protein